MEILYYLIMIVVLLGGCFYISSNFAELAEFIKKDIKLTNQEKKGLKFLKSKKCLYSFLLTCFTFIILSIFIFSGWQQQIFYSLCCIILTACFFMDMSVKLLPDVFTLSLLWIALLASALGISNISPTNAIISSFSIYVGFMLLISILEFFMKKEALGGGDIKIIAAFGAIFGIIPSIIILFLACTIMLIFILLFKLMKKLEDKELPFGVGLTIVAIINIFYPSIIDRITSYLMI